MIKINKVNLEWNGTLAPRESSIFCIVHHDKWIGGTVEKIHNDHVAKGHKGFPYNFWIHKSDGIFEGRPEWASDADAWGHNYDSPSICLNGDFDIEQVGDKQYDDFLILARYILTLYPDINFMRHSDVNATECPGVNMPWARMLKDIDNIRLELKNEVTLEKRVSLLEKEFARFREKFRRHML